ncbi:MAG: DUF4147 domain-containing protein [Gammaproteobacteria bacterium]|nr:DUF4147 domain-containing protein [Gammaproteobacteria bacterium]
MNSDLNMHQQLRQLFDAAIRSVDGFYATAKAVKQDVQCDETLALPAGIDVIAIGKAADAMAQGALSELGNKVVGGLIITKHKHLSDALKNDQRFTTFETGHPSPDKYSLQAGEALVDRVSSLSNDRQLLFLISGGASALVEHLNDATTLEDLESLTEQMLAQGIPIGEMNRRRRQLSKIKGGKLAGFLTTVPVTQFLISDVPGDVLGDIGSGLLIPADNDTAPVWDNIQTRIIASSRIAQQAVAEEAKTLGLTVRQGSGSITGDLHEAVEGIERVLLADSADAGVYIWGGETTVILPPKPGRGGRNQHLALALAERISEGAPLSILCAGTDGTDGPTEDAGGLIDERTISQGKRLGLDSSAALIAADAGRYLDKTSALFTTGPTGTNVMDLVIAIKH